MDPLPGRDRAPAPGPAETVQTDGSSLVWSGRVWSWRSWSVVQDTDNMPNDTTTVQTARLTVEANLTRRIKMERRLSGALISGFLRSRGGRRKKRGVEQ